MKFKLAVFLLFVFATVGFSGGDHPPSPCPPGPQGPQGVQGRDGRDGISVVGPQGIQGLPGRDGRDGKDGVDGVVVGEWFSYEGATITEMQWTRIDTSNPLPTVSGRLNLRLLSGMAVDEHGLVTVKVERMEAEYIKLASGDSERLLAVLERRAVQ